jgi:hypothetical protein
MNKGRFVLTAFASWLVLLMIDFLAHAALLKPFWDKVYLALKLPDELFVLIPFGYIGFLFLILLVGWIYIRISLSCSIDKKTILDSYGYGFLGIGDRCCDPECECHISALV